MSKLSRWFDRLKSLVNQSKKKGHEQGIKQDNDLCIGSGTTNPSRRVASDSTCTISQVSDRGDIRVYEERLGTSCNAHSEYGERTRRETEAERLVSIAKANGQYKSHAEFASLGMKYLKRTGESVVYLNVVNARVYKYRDPFAKGPLKGGVQPEDVIYEHLVHNKYFPETAYHFEGISDEKGDLRILLSQNFIEGYAQPSKAQIEKALSRKGLYPIDKYTYGNDEISVTDLSGDNTLIGTDGEIYFIDPIINFHKPAMELLSVEIREIRSN